MKTIIYAILALTVAATGVVAKPGAVNKQGCHSKPKHCHPPSEINTSPKGFRYVPYGVE